MPITDRDPKIQALYIMGDQAPHTWERQATAFMEAARVILAERLNVQSVAIDPTTESLVLYCDRDTPREE